jgi:hypothetical protein
MGRSIYYYANYPACAETPDGSRGHSGPVAVPGVEKVNIGFDSNVPADARLMGK